MIVDLPDPVFLAVAGVPILLWMWSYMSKEIERHRCLDLIEEAKRTASGDAWRTLDNLSYAVRSNRGRFSHWLECRLAKWAR